MTSRLEMRAELVGARDTQTLVRLRRSVERGWVGGYVASVGPEWFVMCVVADLILFNGFQAFRFKEVESVEAPAPYSGFVERALRLRRQTRPADPAIDLADVATVLSSASAAFPLISIHQEIADPEVCFIGAVEEIARGTLVLKTISPDAAWNEERERFPLRDITRVDFGGLYEEALRLAAEGD
jgi:hypothetical protein